MKHDYYDGMKQEMTVRVFAVLLGLFLSTEGQVYGALRLVDNSGRTPVFAGRLEVYYNGQWGTVCADSFDENAASVACRQLGYTTAEGFNTTTNYGLSAGDFSWLSNLRCQGSEFILDSCPHSGIQPYSNCSHVGLSCSNRIVTDGSLRLQGRNASFGRLEIYYRGQWGTVCDDSFSRNDADVACRQLGFSRGYCWGRVGAFGLPQGRSRIWLDNLNCGSGDTTLLRCRHNGVGVENCGHSEDVAVSCTYMTSCNGLTRTSNNSLSYVYYGGGGFITILVAAFIYCCVKCWKSSCCDNLSDCNCDCDCSCGNGCSNLFSRRTRHQTTWSPPNNRTHSMTTPTNRQPTAAASTTRTRQTSSLLDTIRRTTTAETEDTPPLPDAKWSSTAPPSYDAAVTSSLYKQPDSAPPPPAGVNDPPKTQADAPPPYQECAVELDAYPPC